SNNTPDAPLPPAHEPPRPPPPPPPPPRPPPGAAARPRGGRPRAPAPRRPRRRAARPPGRDPARAPRARAPARRRPRRRPPAASPFGPEPITTALRVDPAFAGCGRVGRRAGEPARQRGRGSQRRQHGVLRVRFAAPEPEPPRRGGRKRLHYRPRADPPRRHRI